MGKPGKAVVAAVIVVSALASWIYTVDDVTSTTHTKQRCSCHGGDGPRWQSIIFVGPRKLLPLRCGSTRLGGRSRSRSRSRADADADVKDWLDRGRACAT